MKWLLILLTILFCFCCRTLQAQSEYIAAPDLSNSKSDVSRELLLNSQRGKVLAIDLGEIPQLSHLRCLYNMRWAWH